MGEGHDDAAEHRLPDRPDVAPDDHQRFALARDESTFRARAATPVASPPATSAPVALPAASDLGLVFPAGIDVTLLAAGTIDQLPADALLLRLERVTVPAGEELATRPPTAPELLFGELGTATIVDAFGLSAPLAAGGQATLTAGSGYTLRNASSGTVTLLRLSLCAQTPPDPAAQILLESQLAALPATPATLVLALSSWQPGTDTGSFTAAGPIGLLLNSGTLTITSPSGLEAPLGPGQGLVFPDGVPQRERNAGSEQAQALLVAIAPIGQPVVAAVPTPTPVPTTTPLPTATALPTATPKPTATNAPIPTATPYPTSTPFPTVTPIPLPTHTSVPTFTPVPTPTPPADLQQTGEIRDFAYDPAEVVIRVGGTVTWINLDGVPHTATANERQVLQSGAIASGESFTQVFGTAGEFDYFCEFHPNMQGTIIVNENTYCDPCWSVLEQMSQRRSQGRRL